MFWASDKCAILLQSFPVRDLYLRLRSLIALVIVQEAELGLSLTAPKRTQLLYSFSCSRISALSLSTVFWHSFSKKLSKKIVKEL